MNNATEYADSLAAQILADTESGNPYGVSDGYGDTPEGEPVGAWDYLSDVLDIEYRVGGDGQYRSALILIAFGGPNAWIDTKTNELIVTWWSEPVRRNLPAPFCEGLDSVCEELFSL